jgi:single-stranded DNA-binding protein
MKGITLDINVQVFSGRIGNIKDMQGEKTEERDGRYIDFSVAGTDHYAKGKGRDKNGDPNDYPTTWLNCRALGRTAGFFADRFEKGDIIVVVGRTDVSTSGEGDDKKYWYRVIVNELSGPFQMAKHDKGNNDNNDNSEPAEKPAAKTASASKSNGNGSSKNTASASKSSTTARKQAQQNEDIPF